MSQKSYNFEIIRQLTMKSYALEELLSMMFITPEFKPFYNQGVDSLRKPILVLRFLAYCERNEILDVLLAKIQKDRPKTYDKYHKNLMIENVPSTKKEALDDNLALTKTEKLSINQAKDELAVTLSSTGNERPHKKALADTKFSVGTKVGRQGRYQILGFLGAGASGNVYRVRDKDLNREVALKFIGSFDESRTVLQQERFRHEVRTVARMKHDHIVTIHNVDIDHNPPYVEMELLRGGTLKTFLKREKLTWDEVLRLLKPLVEALAYAHHQGVVHRDVKPANVMFAGTEWETLKLVDFGLAYWTETERLTKNRIVGTPAYMAPEQARGEEGITAQADVFALGLILFEAIIGYNPQQRGLELYKPSEPLKWIGLSDPIDLSPLEKRGVRQDVIDLITKSTVKDRNKRYKNGKDVLAKLNKILASTKDIPKTRILTPSPINIVKTGWEKMIPLDKGEKQTLKLLLSSQKHICLVTAYPAKGEIRFYSPVDGSSTSDALVNIGDFSLGQYVITRGVTVSDNQFVLTLVPRTSDQSYLLGVTISGEAESKFRINWAWPVQGMQYSTPFFDKNHIYFIQRVVQAHELVRMNAHTGDEYTVSSLFLPKMLNPYLDCASFVVIERMLYLSLCNGTILKFDVETGQLQTTMTQGNPSIRVSPLVVNGQELLFRTYPLQNKIEAGQLQAWNIKSAKKGWHIEMSPDLAGKSKPMAGRPVVEDNIVYIISGRESIQAYDLKMYSILRHYKMPDRIEIPPSVVGDKLIVVDRAGNFRAWPLISTSTG